MISWKKKYDHGLLLFWFCKIQGTNEYILKFQSYINLIVIETVEQHKA
jgi:hypothetical protein